MATELVLLARPVRRCRCPAVGHAGPGPAGPGHRIAVPARPPGQPQVPAMVLDDRGVQVRAVAVTHGHAVPAFAYRFDTADGSVVFSGDTTAGR